MYCTECRLGFPANKNFRENTSKIYAFFRELFTFQRNDLPFLVETLVQTPTGKLKSLVQRYSFKFQALWTKISIYLGKQYISKVPSTIHNGTFASLSKSCLPFFFLINYGPKLFLTSPQNGRKWDNLWKKLQFCAVAKR